MIARAKTASLVELFKSFVTLVRQCLLCHQGLSSRLLGGICLTVEHFLTFRGQYWCANRMFSHFLWAMIVCRPIAFYIVRQWPEGAPEEHTRGTPATPALLGVKGFAYVCLFFSVLKSLMRTNERRLVNV